MKKIIFLFALVLSSVVFEAQNKSLGIVDAKKPAQELLSKDTFNLPDNFYKLKFNKTTYDEVEILFGKPSKKYSRKQPDMKFLVYDKGAVEISFLTKGSNVYKLNNIAIIGSGSMIIGKSIKIGTSNYQQVLKELGLPTYDNLEPGKNISYVVKETNRLYKLTFTNDNVLGSIYIFGDSE